MFFISPLHWDKIDLALLLGIDYFFKNPTWNRPDAVNVIVLVQDDIKYDELMKPYLRLRFMTVKKMIMAENVTMIGVTSGSDWDSLYMHIGENNSTYNNKSLTL